MSYEYPMFVLILKSSVRSCNQDQKYIFSTVLLFKQLWINLSISHFLLNKFF